MTTCQYRGMYKWKRCRFSQTKEQNERNKKNTDGHAVSALWSRANWHPQSRGSLVLLEYRKHCSSTQQPPPPHCSTISDNVVITFIPHLSSFIICAQFYHFYFLILNLQFENVIEFSWSLLIIALIWCFELRHWESAKFRILKLVQHREEIPSNKIIFVKKFASK